MSKPGRSKKKPEQQNSDLTSPMIETPAAESEPTEEQIQARAYEIYLERGGVEGNETDDWLQAERELRGKTEQDQPS
jgi:hypothetical protein